ncbi:ROK family transcriptional regulator [Paenibacillus sp. J2TS4]|uniref:ROK family transcriptional regulator n=1 Tax=Paenibacillus sp. J2TS4 TaxID=2807194 RepID=UPI001B2D0014|nr:ROK family transcriptional regulator [Paenibacillus sp. J2TS4]GIP31641.1 transcriptional regulator [Paenibacillus sp. J2TS4]
MITQSANPSTIRDINRANVLDTIRRKERISQAELAKALSLQPSTILRIITDLLEEGLIIRSGQGQATAKGGRRATLLELRPEGAFAVGVDLNSDEINAVMLDLTGNVVCHHRMASPSDQGPAMVMEALKDVIRELLSIHEDRIDKIIGISVGVPGKVDVEAGTSIYAVNFKNWRNVKIREELEQAFSLPVYVEREMRSMAYGENWFGKEHDHMLCLGLFQSGIGLGLVLNGQLYRGANQLEGDVGHVIVEPDGPICSCGRRGCLEAVASEKAICKRVNENRRKRVDGPSADSKEMNITEIIESFRLGDKDVERFVQEAVSYLGKILCDLVRVYDPKTIVIGGHALASSPEFVEAVRVHFNALQPNYADYVPDIKPVRFAENSTSIGAATLILSRIFKPNGPLAI